MIKILGKCKVTFNIFFIDKKTEDELIDPRKPSARLIAGISKLKTELETEKQNRIRTLQGLKKMKTLHGKGISDLNAELDAEKQNIETLEGVKVIPLK